MTSVGISLTFTKCLREIAAAMSDDSFHLWLPLFQQHHCIQSTPHFETATLLEVITLEHHLERRGAMQIKTIRINHDDNCSFSSLLSHETEVHLFFPHP